METSLSSQNSAQLGVGYCVKIESQSHDLTGSPASAEKDLLHKCWICGKPSSTAFGLQRHLEDYHNTFQCKKCELVFTDYALLSEHQETHPKPKRKPKAPPKSYQCSTCGAEFQTAASFNAHKKSAHPLEERFECDCGRRFFTSAQLENHMLVHTDGNRNFCDICGNYFTSNSVLHTHRRKVHDLPLPYQCPHCEESFADNKSLTQHSFVHRKREHFECELCGMKYYQRISLRFHMEKRHGPNEGSNQGESRNGTIITPPVLNCDKPFQCDMCEKTFRLKPFLTAHRKCHTDVGKPFVCDICGKEFRLKKMLQAHSLVHSNERPHQCTICQKSFAARSYLTVHIRIHTGQERFRCEFCDRGFNSQAHLQGHRRSVHTGERPEKCDICEKTFVTHTRMLQHRRMHTEEKNKLCDICDKAFRTSQQLQRHQKVHLGVWPVNCEICGKGFLDNHRLKKHMPIHTEGRLPHGCDLCEQSFASPSKLATHKRVHLGDEKTNQTPNQQALDDANRTIRTEIDNNS
ncbi:zinc finger protein 62-like [Wyeomyia smithii]|uniref:zinc finger protein 62-like n=1 Tax=Wyeomyia smithii TaxID=174621 RepID=UPI002467AF26|nr:zinc finger protein 62-like [Wyeomyia smithii]XP_055525676.1 zinc finger protein 62-like [Wyeomyia smithii]XP_055525685.1 zinc finger protein 62-like [Wyeomyia smithii]XP_055525692.1 zinc finger protein 62-like [Wyeomyia smithii]XP_055525702.1 zinc finger protein 62-like [Wyeomyia smithii]XP_055525713.1 zinc finger protein 62-like [Wyeomyia smithii]XP_055525720.1 zinc finger protein 62-like [Wyeomyia smithii]